MAIEFRPALPSDRPAILELFRVAFQAEPDALEWEWKYDRISHRSISIVALDEEKAVGFFGGMGTRYQGAGVDFPGTTTVDVMTHPSARSLGRQSFFRDLGEAYKRANAELGIPFDFGFPHERARKIEERLLGCKTIERAGQFTCPLPLAVKKGAFRQLFARVKVNEPFGSPHESLAEKIHSAIGLRTSRSAAVLEWRFRQRPGNLYTTVQLLNLAGRSRGYAVIRLSNDRALLVDIQAADPLGADLPDLLAAISTSLPAEARVVAVRLAQSSPFASRLVSEFDFQPEESDTHLIVRSLRPDFDVENAGKALDYRFCDHDIF